MNRDQAAELENAIDDWGNDTAHLNSSQGCPSRAAWRALEDDRQRITELIKAATDAKP